MRRLAAASKVSMQRDNDYFKTVNRSLARSVARHSHRVETRDAAKLGGARFIVHTLTRERERERERELTKIERGTRWRCIFCVAWKERKRENRGSSQSSATARRRKAGRVLGARGATIDFNFSERGGKIRRVGQAHGRWLSAREGLNRGTWDWALRALLLLLLMLLLLLLLNSFAFISLFALRVSHPHTLTPASFTSLSRGIEALLARVG